jgi:hypothetical protein
MATMHFGNWFYSSIVGRMFLDATKRQRPTSVAKAKAQIPQAATIIKGLCQLLS